MMGHPVRPVALDADFKMDLGKIADAAKGAGLVFYCNPNNPTATYVGAKATRDFLAKVNRESPETTVLVDEAYYDYVTNPDHDTHIPVALDNPRVVVARTFSKAYGMAGLRMGYAVGHADTIKKMRDWDAGSGTSSLNVLALHAGLAAIEQDASFITAERARNTAARDFTMKWFSRSRHEADRLAGQLHVREHRPAGEGIPRRLPRQGRPRRARLPAVREDPLPALVRHDGRDEEGGRGLRRSARQEDRDRRGVEVSALLPREPEFGRPIRRDLLRPRARRRAIVHNLEARAPPRTVPRSDIDSDSASNSSISAATGVSRLAIARQLVRSSETSQRPFVAGALSVAVPGMPQFAEELQNRRRRSARSARR